MTVISLIVFGILAVWYLSSAICIYVSICRAEPALVLPKLVLIMLQIVLLVLFAVSILVYFSGYAERANNRIFNWYRVSAFEIVGATVAF